MSNMPQEQADAPQSPPPKRSMKRFVLLVVIPAIAVIGGGVMYLKGGRYVETDNAYVKADKVPVSAEVSGPVLEVMVKENQQVKAGQPLFRIDPARFDVAVAKAEAELAQVRTDLAALKASYKEKQAEIALARTKLAFAQKELKRQKDLAVKKYVSTANFDLAQQAADLANQEINALELDLKRIAETMGGSVTTPLESHPKYMTALAELNRARLDLARTTIKASVDGIVSQPPKPGQYMNPGVTVMSLVASASPWIEANFTETDLTNVRPGQKVSIHVDTYPGAEWSGFVDSLSPATGAEFSVIPAQNATGNWVKIAQRVPVRITITSDSDSPALRAGLSTVVEIDTEHHRQFLGLSL
ncbi:HlyD family efflux transporter periplasmic adaptor subunit [Photobacterium halotolerans]|uniref:HlyD family secretion protein n=1 Tax=Photobacterium halotolerans TaxID=265726 RepID=UPI001373602E|nr:HlyD family secretion protein [Photobacterium halotolerans]NAX47408.1 HlyD family efflux transporter periplasmic adaptor subunit [Photobacterium halotolerans]